MNDYLIHLEDLLVTLLKLLHGLTEMDLRIMTLNFNEFLQEEGLSPCKTV